ncbi:YggT family protein [Accumulibacter sp.]|uniref:YggT family protein n=1 Tax=Accumulibacter sp. TaxID=2053492 RepID=UPI0025EC77E0|nr:YggT family protein [Accumulibacter sp.]MCP5229628.1 YggT family protein [Accumulibacter sp.]
MAGQAGLFLLQAVTGFLSFALLLRFYMQAFRVSFSNQIGTFVVDLTNWLVKPLRKALPGLWGLDLASLLPAYLLQVIFTAAMVSVQGNIEAWSATGLLPLLLWQGVLATLRLSIYLLIGALLVQAVLSWVSPYSPLSQPVGQLTRPFLRPIQRVVPTIGAVDLSPLIAIVLAQVVLMFL